MTIVVGIAIGLAFLSLIFFVFIPALTESNSDAAFWTVFAIYGLLYLSFWCLVLYVVIHFITKYW